MQALALGLPCLASRWIEDSVARSKVQDWEAYLLPSGESAYLHGAIRSRVLQPYDAETARFITTIRNRKVILEGRSVLLVVGTGKTQQELRKAYVFLTCALGARRVERVATIDEARKRIIDHDEREGGAWDWVYVDEAQPGTVQLLHGGGAAAATTKGKKRKRASTAVAEAVPLALEGTPESLERLKRVKVVGNDFVTQSLILGRLVKED
jgi:tRNA-splicing endonuclease subunit Sen2